MLKSVRRWLWAAALVLGLAPALTPGPGPLARDDGVSEAFHGVRPVAMVGEHLDGTAFKIPQGLFYDPAHDELFVADSGNGLIGIFSGKGVPKFTFAPALRGAYPVAVATDTDGKIYVVNAGSRRLRIFSYRGEPVRDIEIGVIRGAKSAPSAVTVSPDGTIYVLDGLGGRILVYEQSGELRTIIQGSARGGGRLQAPVKVTLGPDNNLYVSDRRGGDSIQVYSPAGRYVRGFGSRGMGPTDFAVPGGLAVDEAGRVYVADIIRQEIKVFDGAGEFIGRFGGLGNQPGEMAYPSDVALGGDRIFVVERVGRRVQAFQILGPGNEGESAPVEDPRPTGQTDPTGTP